VAVAPDGTVNVIWEGRDAQHDYPRIKLVQSSDGGQTWTQWSNVIPDSYAQSRPTMVFPADGQAVILAYEADANGTAHIVAARFQNASDGWGQWATISPPSEDSRNVTAVVSGAGITAAWRASPDPSSAHIEVATSPDGMAWGQPVVVPTTGRAYDLFPSIGVAGGQLQMVYVSSDQAQVPHEDPVEGALIVATQDQAGAWTVRDTGDRATIATIASDSNQLGIAYVSSSSGRYRIQFSLQP